MKGIIKVNLKMIIRIRITSEIPIKRNNEYRSGNESTNETYDNKSKMKVNIRIR